MTRRPPNTAVPGHWGAGSPTTRAVVAALRARMQLDGGVLEMTEGASGEVLTVRLSKQQTRQPTSTLESSTPP